MKSMLGIITTLILYSTSTASKPTNQEITAGALINPAVDILDVLTATCGKAGGTSSVNKPEIVDKFICPLTNEITNMIIESMDLVDNDDDLGIPSTLRTKFKQLNSKSSPFVKLIYDDDHHHHTCEAVDRFENAISRVAVTLKNTSDLHEKREVFKTENTSTGINILSNGAAAVLRIMKQSLIDNIHSKNVDTDKLNELYFCPISNSLASLSSDISSLLNLTADDKTSTGIEKTYVQNLIDSGSSFSKTVDDDKNDKFKLNKCRHHGFDNLRQVLSNLSKETQITPDTVTTVLFDTAAVMITATAPENSTTTSSAQPTNKHSSQSSEALPTGTPAHHQGSAHLLSMSMSALLLGLIVAYTI